MNPYLALPLVVPFAATTVSMLGMKSDVRSSCDR